MNEDAETQDISPEAPESEDTVVLIKKMQKHLVYLEKKIDTVLEKLSQQKPSFRDKPFSKPFRSGGNFRRREGGGFSGDRDRGFSGNRDRGFSKPFRSRFKCSVQNQKPLERF